MSKRGVIRFDKTDDLVHDLQRAVYETLKAHDKTYHFDDDPSEVVNHTKEGDQRGPRGGLRFVFSHSECDALRGVMLGLHRGDAMHAMLIEDLPIEERQ